MKVAPIIKAIKAHNGLVDEGISGLGERISYRLVHTGQHYDKNMSDTFFEELGIPAPDVNLGCGGGTQTEQTAHIMVAFEKELLEHPTDVVLVVGDVTSTMACSIVAKKLNTKVCHVEWDSPGKNTGVGCHFLLQCMKVESESEVTQSCPTLCDPMNHSTPGLPVHHQLPEFTQTQVH